MQTVLIVVHLMIVSALVVVVLLQRSEGGALGVGGGSGFMTGRGAANVLTRTTSILAICFFTTSLALAIIANRGGDGSAIDRFAPAPASQTPGGEQPGGVLDDLRNEGRGSPAAPPAPQTPQPPQSR